MLNQTNFSKSTSMVRVEADTRADISVQVLANNWKNNATRDIFILTNLSTTEDTESNKTYAQATLTRIVSAEIGLSIATTANKLCMSGKKVRMPKDIILAKL
jgi:hypothetical protein